MKKELILFTFAFLLIPSIAFAQTDLQITQTQAFPTSMTAGSTYTAIYNIKGYSSSPTPIFFTLYVSTSTPIDSSELNLDANINGLILTCTKVSTDGYPRNWESWKCMNGTSYYNFPAAPLWWIIPSSKDLYLNLSLNVAASPQSNLDWRFEIWVEDSLAPEIILESPANGSFIKPGTLLNFTIRDNVKLSQAFSESQLFDDNFDDGNDLQWTHILGSWNVESGEYSQDSGLTDTYYFTTEGYGNWTDYMLEARIKVIQPYGTVNAPSVLVRFKNLDNFYMCQLRIDQNSLYIMKRFSGAWTLLNSTTFVTNLDEWHALKCKVEGNKIFAYLHNSTHGINLQATDNDIDKGRIGLSNYNSHTHFDNISVVSVDPFTSPYDIDTSTWTEGLYALKIHAIDIVGNQGRSYFEFIIDNTPPRVENSTVNKTIPQGENATITVDVKDNVKVDKVIVEDNKTANYTMQLVGEKYIVTIINPAFGNHSLRYFVNDTAGNVNDTVYDWFNVVPAAPPVVASIIIEKQTDPDGDTTLFTFSGDVSGSIADGGTLEEQVGPGTYSATETVPLGWDLTSIVCDDTDSSGNLGTATATFVVSAGETVKCTFTNTKRGTIIVDKVTDPSGDSQSFDFTTTGNDYVSFSLTDQSIPNDQELKPGAYTVSETVPSGWDLTNLNCVDTSGGTTTSGNTANVDLAAGETVTCTFTNTKRGTIIVEEQTNPDGAPGSFTLTGTAAGAISDNGQIVVSDLVPGTYTSTESDPTPSFDLTSIVCDDGSSQTPSSGDVATRTATFKVDPGETVKCVFTNIKLGEVRGIKFKDIDGNGVKDFGETGLSGWTIYADLNDNEKLDFGEPSTGTGFDGSYTLRGLFPGIHTIREVVKKGWVYTKPTDGKYVVQITIGSVITGKDFGNFKLGSISGIKFRDTNGNGVRDSGETKLSGWTIFLDTNDNGVLDPGEQSTITTASGKYEFTGLVAGTYIVREVLQPGWKQTAPAGGKYTVVIISGSTVTGKDFGNKLGEIHGVKYEDKNGNGILDLGEPRLSRWTIYLDLNNNGRRDGREPSEVTDRDGKYEFLDLPLGTYIVREVVKSGWTQTAPIDGKHIVEITNAEVVTGKDFGNFKLGSISGIKFKDTNGDGVRNTGEARLSRWTIYIDMNDNGQFDQGEPSVVTGSNGRYEFENLGPGTYIIREAVKEGWKQTTPAGGKHVVTLSSGSDVKDKDFGNKLGEIRGMKFEDLDGDGIRDSNEKGLRGWTIYLDINNDGIYNRGEPSSVTDRNGEYEFSDLTAGTYIVREVVKSGWTQTAPTDGKYVVTLSSGSVSTGNDFGNFKLGSISGIKFRDTNGNGVRNAGEARLSGWTIYLDKNDNGALDGGEPSTVTDRNGKYQFTNLGPGTYNVREVLPDGWTQTSPLAPGKYTIVLISGLEVTGKDFGNKPV